MSESALSTVPIICFGIGVNFFGDRVSQEIRALTGIRDHRTVVEPFGSNSEPTTQESLALYPSPGEMK
ncbi:hypothetical protein [Planktotalea frisia]|jgi:hypothetical protein|uniref:hypothetical protein n=1 Tax=Planktotalea frisia TaxID=696762 RepID=UPI001473FCBD|nr:hypothetical protein [Planktotalea frisia]